MMNFRLAGGDEEQTAGLSGAKRTGLLNRATKAGGSTGQSVQGVEVAPDGVTRDGIATQSPAVAARRR